MAITTYRGHIRNGKITLDQPATLPEGAELSVHLIETNVNSASGQIDRRRILEMPVEQRRPLLMKQAERLAEFYGSDEQRTEWQGGDILQ